MADSKGKRPAEVLTEAEVRSLLAACSRRAAQWSQRRQQPLEPPGS